MRSKQIDGIPRVYLNRVLQKKMARHWFSVTTAGGVGRVSTFLTSDGATKTAGNTFLFTAVFGGDGGTTTIQTLAEACACFGFQYNVTTGLAEWVFEESNTDNVLIGGTTTGLEYEENGTTILVWVEGNET